jgi:hypothetical protein
MVASFGSPAFCQKEVQSVQQIWAGVFNQTRFNDRWGMWADLHLRTKADFTKDFSSGILRFGLTYYLKDDVKLTAGYAFINHFPADAHPDISQPEHRPWQQIQWHNRYPKLRVMQWVRLEERYRRKLAGGQLADGYNFNYRVRHAMMLMFPLGKRRFQPKSLSFVVNDELHINFGKEIVLNPYDHNRFFLGFNYHLNAHDNLQFGYMNFFQQQAAGNKFRSLHVARVFLFHNLDLRKKEPSTDKIK